MATFWTPGTTSVPISMTGPSGVAIAQTVTYGNPIDTGTDYELAGALREQFAARNVLRENPIMGPVNIVVNPIVWDDTSTWAASKFGVNAGSLTSSLTRQIDTTAGSGRGVELQFAFETPRTTGDQVQIYPAPTTLSTYNAAASGEAWSFQCYVKVIAGGADIATLTPDVGYKTAANAFLSQSLGTKSTLSSFTGGWQLVTCTNAVAPATTGFVYAAITLGPVAVPSGGTVTLRITQAALVRSATVLPWVAGIYADGTTSARSASLGVDHASPSYKLV